MWDTKIEPVNQSSLVLLLNNYIISDMTLCVLGHYFSFLLNDGTETGKL